MFYKKNIKIFYSKVNDKLFNTVINYLIAHYVSIFQDF